jgi:hypothetical protein
MDDNLALLPRPLRFSIFSVFGCLELFAVTLVQQRRYPQAECPSL